MIKIFKFSYIYLFCLLTFPFFSYSEDNNKTFINFDYPEEIEEYSGGNGTVKVNNKNSYSLPMKNLRSDQKIDFLIGNGLFKRDSKRDRR